MIRALCFIVCLAFTGTLCATDYYVDSESGNDTNPGTSPQQAWASLEAVNNAALAPGDRVLFKRGGIWRGQIRPQSGEAERPITYSVYGDGTDKPQIRGSMPLDKPTGWIDEGNGIWATKPIAVQTGSTIDGFDKQTWRVYQAEGADVSLTTHTPNDPAKANEQEYRIVCRNSGTQSHHVDFFTVVGFKIEKDKHYLFRFEAKSSQPFTMATVAVREPVSPWRNVGRVLHRPGEITTEFQTREILFRAREDHDNARFVLVLGRRLPQDAEFVFIPKELLTVTVESNGIDTDVGNIILNGNKSAFKRWQRDDLKEQDDFWYDLETTRVFFRSDRNPATLYESLEAALHRYVVDHSSRRYIIFDGLDIRYGGSHGFGGWNAEHIIYRNLDISWIGGSHQGMDENRVRFGNGIEFWADASDCLVEDCRFWEIYDAAVTNQASGKCVQRRLTYRRNLIWNCEFSFEYFSASPESVTEDILFEYNICVDAGYGWGHVQRPDKNGRHLWFAANSAKTARYVVRNNIFCNATHSIVRIDMDWRDGLTMENNLYWQPADKDFMFWLNRGQTRYRAEQFAEYQNELGLDRSSTFAKPDLSRYQRLPEEVRQRER